MKRILIALLILASFTVEAQRREFLWHRVMKDSTWNSVAGFDDTGAPKLFKLGTGLSYSGGFLNSTGGIGGSVNQYEVLYGTSSNTLGSTPKFIFDYDGTVVGNPNTLYIDDNAGTSTAGLSSTNLSFTPSSTGNSTIYQAGGIERGSTTVGLSHSGGITLNPGPGTVLIGSNTDPAIISPVRLDVRGITSGGMGYIVRFANEANDDFRFLMSDRGNTTFNAYTSFTSTQNIFNFLGGASPTTGTNEFVLMKLQPQFYPSGGTNTFRGLQILKSGTDTGGDNEFIAIETNEGAIRFQGLAEDDALTKVIVYDDATGDLKWKEGGSSGTYTPTLTGVTNITSVISDLAFKYSRVGNMVQVYGTVNITPTAVGAMRLDITLPIASNLAADADLVGNANDMLGANGYGGIRADATDDEALVTIVCTSTSATTYTLNFMYEVK